MNLRAFLSALLVFLVLISTAAAAGAQSLVFEEDFENVPLGTRVDGIGWEMDYAFPNTRTPIAAVNSSFDPLWDVQNDNYVNGQPQGGNPPSDPSGSPFGQRFMLLSYSVADDEGEVEDYSVGAITPLIDLAATSTAVLEFDLFNDGFQAAPNDYFEVWLSDDDGGSWQGPFNQVQIEQTVNPTATSETVDLAPVAGSDQVRIAFVAHGDDIFSINAWAVDNIVVGQPVVEVRNEGTSQTVNNGSTDDVGGATIQESTVSAYSIRNDGIGGSLTINSINVVNSDNIVGGNGGVNVSGPGTSTLPPSQLTTFQLTYTPDQEAPFTIEVEIEVDELTDDFTFILAGEGTFQPVLVLEGPSGSSIGPNEEGDAGSVPRGGGTISLSIRNAGDAPLELSGSEPVSATAVTNASVEVASQPGSFTIAPGGTTTFSLAIDPEEGGEFELTVTVQSNDEDNPSYTVTLLGTATISIGSGDSGGCAHADGAGQRGWLFLLLLAALGALRRRYEVGHAGSRNQP